MLRRNIFRLYLCGQVRLDQSEHVGGLPCQLLFGSEQRFQPAAINVWLDDIFGNGVGQGFVAQSVPLRKGNLTHFRRHKVVFSLQ